MKFIVSNLVAAALEALQQAALTGRNIFEELMETAKVASQCSPS